MGSRTTLLAAVVTALALSTPAYGQSDVPSALFEAAPAEAAGAATPTDGGRSTLLLGLALLCVAGAGVSLGLAVRPRRSGHALAAPEPVIVAEPIVAPAPEPVVTTPVVAAPAPVERTGRFRKPPAPQRPRRFRAARATAAEASASARMGMPVVLYGGDEPEPPAPPEKPAWQPRVHSDLPPLPAFGSDRPPDAG